MSKNRVLVNDIPEIEVPNFFENIFEIHYGYSGDCVGSYRFSDASEMIVRCIELL